MKISIKALIIGFLINVGGAILVSLINFSMTYFNIFPTFFEDNLTTMQLVSYGFFSLTILFNILAGYTCAKFAKKEELLHGVILGAIIWFISLTATYFIYNIINRYQFTFGIQQLLSLIWCMSASLLGAFICKRIKDKRNEENLSPLEQKIENLGNN